MTQSEWRDCPDYGGKEYRVGATFCRNCSAVDALVMLEQCASCPIPAKDELIAKLVGAVQDASKWFWVLANAGADQHKDIVGVLSVGMAAAQMDAALAAYEEAVKEVAS